MTARLPFISLFLPFRSILLGCFAFLGINGTASSQIIQVPTVVHIVSNNPDAISDVTIINAIKNLNDGFTHSGGYASNDTNAVDTEIRFCLAQTDPNGGITNGITRTKSVFADYDLDIENKIMKNLISWDNSRYFNIWFVEGIKSEVNPIFQCGGWSRGKLDAFTTFPPTGDFTDGVVVTKLNVLLIHETGHFLGLKHTFEGGCKNDNCAVDGDGICDTPPQAFSNGECSRPSNTCDTDTISGPFKIDMPDMVQNFMNYSACRNMFTKGQKDKMRKILQTVRSGLIQAPSPCPPPCSENLSAVFNRDNWYPTVGSTITFNALSNIGTAFEWYINDVRVGTNDPQLVYPFTALGRYKVTLKVRGSDPNCFASNTHYVIVTCGIFARFYADKRLIASKDPVYLDTIAFVNRSYGGQTFRWLMRYEGGPEIEVSQKTDLIYPFTKVGQYSIRLIAEDANCADTTESFSFQVVDPTQDAVLQMNSIECYQDTMYRVSLNICNTGYQTIPRNLPISFYDRDPRLPGALKIDSTFFYPDSVKGICCGPVVTYIVNVKYRGLNTMFVVANDTGRVLPVVLPNTSILEKSYANNFAELSGIRYRSLITPPSALMEPGDTLILRGGSQPIPAIRYTWNSIPELNCTNCQDSRYIARRRGQQPILISESQYQCRDTIAANIRIATVDDFIIQLKSVDCYLEDSLLVNFSVCNQYKRGYLPKDLKVSFYDGDPLTGGQLLQPTFRLPDTLWQKCADYRFVCLGKGVKTLFAVVNDNGSNIRLPNDTIQNETNYANNVHSIPVPIERIRVMPADTSVMPKSNVNLSIANTIYHPSSVLWTPGFGHTLNCTQCTAPAAWITNTGTLNVQMLSRYKCTIYGDAQLRILPPDFTVDVTQTECFDDLSTIVRFRVCMNNQYDTMFRYIPVSFYDKDPYKSKALAVGQTFVTGPSRLVPCDTFSVVVGIKPGTPLFAAVNDWGKGNFPDTMYAETNPKNNTDSMRAEPFQISFLPKDTLVLRKSSFQIRASITSGIMKSILWSPVELLSCASCLFPRAYIPHSQKFILTARNQYYCTFVDTLRVKTFAESPVSIPNAFTPNDDGLNDVFYVMGGEELEDVLDFAIYDRYGQVVYRRKNIPPNDPAFGWNGKTPNGNRHAADTYVYAIWVQFDGGKKTFLKGTVTLLR